MFSKARASSRPHRKRNCCRDSDSADCARAGGFPWRRLRVQRAYQSDFSARSNAGKCVHQSQPFGGSRVSIARISHRYSKPPKKIPVSCARLNAKSWRRPPACEWSCWPGATLVLHPAQRRKRRIVRARRRGIPARALRRIRNLARRQRTSRAEDGRQFIFRELDAAPVEKSGAYTNAVVVDQYGADVLAAVFAAV